MLFIFQLRLAFNRQGEELRIVKRQLHNSQQRVRELEQHIAALQANNNWARFMLFSIPIRQCSATKTDATFVNFLPVPRIRGPWGDSEADSAYMRSVLAFFMAQFTPGIELGVSFENCHCKKAAFPMMHTISITVQLAAVIFGSEDGSNVPIVSFYRRFDR